jgi:hypothetical protein
MVQELQEQSQVAQLQRTHGKPLLENGGFEMSDWLIEKKTDVTKQFNNAMSASRLIDNSLAEAYHTSRITTLQSASSGSKAAGIGANLTSQSPGRYHELLRYDSYTRLNARTFHGPDVLEEKNLLVQSQTLGRTCCCDGFPVKLFRFD